MSGYPWVGVCVGVPTSASDCVERQPDTRNWIILLEAFLAMLPWLTIDNHSNYAQFEPVYHADMKLLKQYLYYNDR